MLCILLFLPAVSSCQEDPCTPNPCGDNTRCASSYSGSNPVISCECLIGYHVPDGGDPFDGCIEQSVAGGTSRGGGGGGGAALPAVRLSTAQRPPYLLSPPWAVLSGSLLTNQVLCPELLTMLTTPTGYRLGTDQVSFCQGGRQSQQ